MTSNVSQTRGLTGWHVLLALGGFFAVIFAVNGIFVYQAESTFGGLDTDDAYRKGLNYNERIEAAAAMQKLGWRDSVTYVADGKRLRISVSDPAGDGVSGLSVTAVAKHPATTRFDQELALQPTGPGTYEVAAPGLTSGWWTVEITARNDAPLAQDAALYEARRRLWIKP
jgi:nitrogen fixation protein FixH